MVIGRYHVRAASYPWQAAEKDLCEECAHYLRDRLGLDVRYALDSPHADTCEHCERPLVSR